MVTTAVLPPVPILDTPDTQVDTDTETLPTPDTVTLPTPDTQATLDTLVTPDTRE